MAVHEYLAHKKPSPLPRTVTGPYTVTVVQRSRSVFCSDEFLAPAADIRGMRAWDQWCLGTVCLMFFLLRSRSKELSILDQPPKSRNQVQNKLTFGDNLWGSTPWECLSQKVSSPIRIGRGKLATLRSWEFPTRRVRSKTSTAALDSYGGTLKACSDRIGTTAIRAALADLPLGHILRVRGVLFETWQGGENSRF